MQISSSTGRPPKPPNSVLAYSAAALKALVKSGKSSPGAPSVFTTPTTNGSPLGAGSVVGPAVVSGAIVVSPPAAVVSGVAVVPGDAVVTGAAVVPPALPPSFASVHAARPRPTTASTAITDRRVAMTHPHVFELLPRPEP